MVFDLRQLLVIIAFALIGILTTFHYMDTKPSAQEIEQRKAAVAGFDIPARAYVAKDR